MSALVLKYSFESNEIDGLTIYNSSYGARDLSANFSAPNMTSSNTYIVGGQSAYFAGSSFITLPDISNLSSSITVSLWAFIATSRSQRILELRNSTQRYFISYDAYNNIIFNYNTSKYIFTNSAITTNNWHHIAWVITPNAWRMFVNNNKNVSSQTTNFTGVINGATSYLGKGSIDNPFMGYADDLRIYTGALSDDQIYEIYDRGTYLNYYRFEIEDVVSGGAGYGTVVANMASGLPVYDASIVAVSAAYGTSAFNVVTDVFKSGNASIYSNGTAGNYVSLSPINNINPAGITLSVWYYAQTNSGKQTICSIGTSSSHWVISHNGTTKQIALSYYTGSSNPLTLRGEMVTSSMFPNGYLLGNNLYPAYLRYGGTTIEDNVWNHITWSITPTYWKIQINGQNSILYSSASMSTIGVSMSTVLTAMPTAFTANTLFTNPFLTPNLNGYIDDMRVYNRVLSDDEIYKLYNYRCLRTNYYSSDGSDLINVFDYNTGVSAGISTGYKNEANELIHNIFAPFSPAIVTPQLTVNAHLYTETVLHISDYVSGDANPVRAIDRIQLGQIVSSSTISSKPYVLSIDRNTNTVVLNKSGGTVGGNSGIGYAGYISAANGLLHLLMDPVQQRSYSGNAPTAGDLVYHSLIPIGTYVKEVYEYANQPVNVPVLANGSFTAPALANNTSQLVTSPYSSIVNWDISANNAAIYIANNSAFWGFPTLPTGITQWLVVQSGGVNSRATASYTFTLNSVGKYYISYYVVVRQTDNSATNNTISASINGETKGAIYVGNSAWSLQTLYFIGVEGNNTVTFTFSFGAANESAIYLTGVSLTSATLVANTNTSAYVQYTMLLSNGSVNIPISNGENVLWKKTISTGFYTPTEFSGDTGYFLLSSDGRYEDYVYKLYSLGGNNTPFTATGTYTVVDHGNGYYTITYTDFGSIRFVSDVASIQLLMVGSGGAGGRAVAVPTGGLGTVVGGGGGEGGQVVYYSSYGIIPNNVYFIDIGMGGISLINNNRGSNGSPTRFGNEVAMGGGGGNAGTLAAGGGAVGGAGGAGLTNGGDGGQGGNTLAQVGGDGILVSFGINSPTYYGGGGAGGNGGNIFYGSTPNMTTVNGGVGGGGNNGVSGVNGTGGGGGGGNGFNANVGNGGKGVVMVYVGAPPDAPRALTLTARTNTTIGLTFKPPNRIALSYTVYATPLRGGGATISQTFSGTSHTITGLSPNTEYTIYVTAQNSVGSSTSPSIVLSTLPTLSPKPEVQIIPVDNTSVDIYANSPNTFPDTYSAYLTLYYTPFTSTPTYTSRTNYLHISNLVKNTWYIAYVNGTTTYGGMETTSQLLRTKNVADAAANVVVGTRTGETVQISFSRPTVDNGAAALFHYTFDTITVNGNDVGNIASGDVVYDASLSVSSISNFSRYGTGSLLSTRFAGFPFKINKTFNFSQYTAISLCFWVNASRLYRGSFDTQPLWLFSFNNSATNSNNSIVYALRFQSFGGLTLYVANRTYVINVSTPRNAWMHIALTQTINTTSGGSGTLNVYINGTLRFTNTAVDTSNDNMVASVNYLGSQNDGNAFYDGYMDDYRLYNIELNATQIASIVNNTFSLMYPIDYYRVYYGDITSISPTSNIAAYKVHPRLIKSGRIANLKYDALALYNTPVYDASLVNTPFAHLSKNYYELTLNATLKQCIQLSALTIGTGGFTFACWFRSNASPSSASVFFASGASAATAAINVYISGNDLVYSLDGTMSPRTLRSGGMNANGIYHLVLVLSARSGTTCTVTAYLNGASIYTESGITYPQIVARSSVYLGRNAESDVYLNGGISDVFMWNRPITFTETSYLYNNAGITFSQQTIADIPSSSSLSYTVTGLIPRKVFATVVATVNADGESYSDAMVMKTLNVPDAPAGFAVYGITDISASFTFTPPDQAVSYYLLSLKTYSSQTSSYLPVVDLSFTDIPYSYGGLTKNTNYTAFLYAINNDGTSPFTAAIFTTLKEPDPPSNIVLTTIGNTFVQFSFSPATGYNILAYDLSAIAQDVGETNVYVSFTYNAFTTSYTMNGLKGGVEYVLYFSARNVFGNSPAITVAFQTTFIPNSPTNFVVSATTDTTLSVSYTPPLQMLTHYILSVSPTKPTLFRNIAFSPQTVAKTQPNDVVCMAISASSSPTRLAILGTNTGLKYCRVVNGIWGSITTPVVNFSVSPPMNAVTACAITPSASRVVVAYGMGTVYWGDSTGLLSGIGNTLYLIAVADTTPRLCYGVAITADASRIIATEYNGYVYFAAWSGTNYGALTRTYETTLRKYGGVDVSTDGEKIAYCGDNGVYWAYWNGANYLVGTRTLSNVNGTRALGVSFVYRDEDILAVSSLNGRPQYCVWNYAAGNYESLIDVSSTALPITQGYGLASDASGNLYLSPFSDTNIYTTAVSYQKYSPVSDVSLSPSATTGTVTGLLKNTQYTLSLVAYNVYGGSPPVTTSGTTTNPPDAVSSISSISTNIQVDLSYCAPRQTTSSYYVAVESSGVYYYKTISSLSTRFAGLSPDTSYTATIDAINSAGNSPNATYAFSTTNLPSTPNPPTVWAVSTSTADLYFTLPEYDASLLDFAGNTQIAATAASEFAFATGTVECWFKTASNSAGVACLVAKKGAYGIFVNGTKLAVYNYVSNAWYINTSFSVNDDYFHHAALVFQDGVSGGSALYFDGQLVTTYTHNVSNQSEAFSVGCVAGETASNYVGNICEVRVWSVAQTAASIMMYYNKRLRQQYAGLAGYFPMIEGEGTAVKNAVKSSGVVSLPITSAAWTTAVLDIIDLSNTSYSVSVVPTSDGVPSIQSVFVGRNVSVAGLVASRTYSAYLSSTNIFGNAPTSSAPINITTRAATSPFPPADFALTGNTDVSLSYTFARPADNPTSYKIYASPIYGNRPLVSATLSGISASSITGVLAGLTSNVKYLVYATALTAGNAESPPSNTVVFTAPFPSPTITLNSFTDVSASLTVSPANYFVEYYIATFVNRSGGNDVVITFTSATSTLSGLTTATLYSLSVVAVAKGVQSLSSNTVTFYTEGITTSPQTLSVTSFGDTSATISFTPPQYGIAYSYRVVASTNTSLVSSLSFTNYSTPITNKRNDTIGISISQPASVRLAIFATLANISFSRIVNGTWGEYTTANVSGISSIVDFFGTGLTSNGTRAVVIHGTYNSTGLIYWGNTSDLLNGNSANLALTQTLETNAYNYADIALTADGSRLVAAVRYGYIYYATWNGTNYSAFTQTVSSTPFRDYRCICVSSDGERIAYCENTNVYWAVWDTSSSDYINEKYAWGVQTVISRSISFLGDNKDVMIYAGANSSARYYIWNGVNYVLHSTPITTLSIPSTDNWAFTVDANNTVYTAPYANTNVYISTANINYAASQQIVQTFSASASSYTITGLTSYRSYDISLSAINSFGASPVATTSVVCGGTTGTLVTNSAYTLYRFTQSGTLTISGARTVYYVIVGGGGNGPNCSTVYWNIDAPGAGAGGVVSGVINQTASTIYTIYVGRGGVAAGFTRVQNPGNPSRVYYGDTVLIADGGQSSESGSNGGAAGTTTKGLSGVANVTESGAATAGSNKGVGFTTAYTLAIGTTTYQLGGGGAGANSGTAGQTGAFGGGGGAITGVTPISGAANTGGGGGGHIAFTSSTSVRSQTASGGSGVVLFFY